MSVAGPGRVKTRSGKGGAESFSQLPSSESSCQHKPTLTSTQSRWKFYTEVGHRSFHTAWALFGHGARSDLRPLWGATRTLYFGAVREAFAPSATSAANFALLQHPRRIH